MTPARATVEAVPTADVPPGSVPPEDDPLQGGTPQTSDETRKRAIARAVWTEIHWLMPRDRTVVVTVAGDAIDVEFRPADPLLPLSPRTENP